MDTRLVAAAIPLFGLFIALEWWVSNRRQVKVYRLFDAISDLSCGIAQQADDARERLPDGSVVLPAAR